MDWQTRLVTTYLTVCNIFHQHGFRFCLERMSNSGTVSLTDEEVLTVYLHWYHESSTYIEEYLQLHFGSFGRLVSKSSDL